MASFGLVCAAETPSPALLLVNKERRVDLGSLNVGNTPEGIDLSPDGTELWTATRGDGDVSVIDVATAVIDLKTLEVTARFSPGSKPDGMAWVGQAILSPAGR